MKAIKIVLILSILSLFLVSCSENPIVQDAKTYPTVIKALVMLEIDFEKNFTYVKESLKDQPEMAISQIKSTLIPKSQEMVSVATQAKPKTDALIKLNDLLLSVINKRHEALLSLQKAIESKEVATIQNALKKFEEASEAFNKQFVEVKALVQKLSKDAQ